MLKDIWEGEEMFSWKDRSEIINQTMFNELNAFINDGKEKFIESIVNQEKELLERIIEMIESLSYKNQHGIICTNYDLNRIKNHYGLKL